MIRANSISVIIGTLNRPELVLRAIRSVLNQTHQPHEIIVVVDGPDAPTMRSLKTIGDPRLRVIQNPVNIGCSGSRGVGAGHATGQWIALLDDDDEWLPDKLAIQLECAAKANVKWPIISGRSVVKTGSVDLVWPRRHPHSGEKICDYLFRRSLPIYGEGAVLTCTIMAPRELLMRVPFSKTLRRLDDIDWLLRATREPGVELVFPTNANPLAICYIEANRTHASADGTWRISLDWGRERREFFTREAYAGFICGNVSSRAGKSRDPKLFWELLSEARRRGRPSWVDYVSHVGNFLITRKNRDMISGLLKRLRIV